MTISDKLISINNTKSAIKSAIEAKGVTVGSVPFADYPSKITAISGGGGGTDIIEPWTRPADWLAMPSFSAGEQKVCILLAVFNNDTNAIAFYNAGAYTVDWGDGTVTNHTSFSQAEKIYDYASISNDTLSTRGYKQVMVTITPQAGQDLTSLNLRQVHTIYKIGTNPVKRNYLDVVMSVPYCTSIALGNNSSNHGAQTLCERVEIKEIGSVTTVQGLCAYHSNLQQFLMPIPTSLTNTSYMFLDCKRLREVSGANYQNVTNATQMFQGCSLLKKVAGDFSSTTNISNMFNGCSQLTEINATFGSQIVTCDGAFRDCNSLKAIPSFGLSNTCISTNYLFYGCEIIKTFPDVNMTGVKTVSNMFQNCLAMEVAPNLNIGTALTTTDNMFQGCISLKEIPFFNTSGVTSFSNWTYGGIFNGCVSLTKVPVFDTSKSTTFGQLFNGCASLPEVPALDMSKASTTDGYSTYNLFVGCRALSKIGVYGCMQTFSVGDCSLSPSALNALYQNLGGPVNGKTLTVTNNWGATAYQKTVCTTTQYSTTVSQSNTAGLVVGQLVTGANINTAVTVTTVDATNRVNRYMHGLTNGRRVAFATLTGTSGVAIKTIYYVVNADSDGFQLSLTPGGAVIDLVGDGSGTIVYPTYITGITPNTSFEVDIPASATGTTTLTMRLDDTSWATMRGWSIT